MPSPRFLRIGKVLAVTAAGLVILGFMLRWLERFLVYFPSTHMAANGTELGRPVEDVFLTTRDGVRINGWFYPASLRSSRSHLVLLLLHGNAGNITHRLDCYQLWLELGVNVFALDYRGFGLSQGRPSEDGTYLDAAAACAWLVARGFQPGQIVALGESLGGGVASELVLNAGLGGLVLQSSFTNIPDLGAELYPWLPVRWLAKTRYDTLSRLPGIHCPVLIMHSRTDTLIPFHHAERNFAAANNPKTLWEIRGDHDNALDAGRAVYKTGLENYLVQHFATAPAP
jgi:uncharacterized protein